MKREEKIRRKIARANARRERRNRKYFEKIREARKIDGYRVPLSAIDEYGCSGSWRDPSSPTGYSQVCSYMGICQAPCNGDC